MIIDVWGGVCSWCLIWVFVYMDGFGIVGVCSFFRYNIYIFIICIGIEFFWVEYL